MDNNNRCTGPIGNEPFARSARGMAYWAAKNKLGFMAAEFARGASAVRAYHGSIRPLKLGTTVYLRPSPFSRPKQLSMRAGHRALV